MQANSLFFFALLFASTSSYAEELPDSELLEFLGGYEIEVNGEIVDPISLDLEENSDEVTPITTRQTS